MNILLYHLVGEGSGPMTVPLHRFIQQMELLAAGHYRLLTEDDLHAHVRSAASTPTDAVLLTFDDGYANTLTTVLPVLDRLGLPALMALCSGYLGADLPRRVRHPVQEMADLGQVRRWIDSGRDVAAHGYTHHRLPQEKDLALRWQVGGDHETHASLLDEVPRTFVYPYGAHDRRVRDVVAEWYPLALTTDEHHRPDSARPYELSRIQVDPTWSLGAFRVALDSHTDPASAQRAARRVDIDLPPQE